MGEKEGEQDGKRGGEERKRVSQGAEGKEDRSQERPLIP